MNKGVFIILGLLSAVNLFGQNSCNYKVIALNKFDASAFFRVKAYTAINIPISIFHKVRKQNSLFRTGVAIRGDLKGLENDLVPFCQIKKYILTEVKVEQDSVYPGSINIRLIYSPPPKKM